MAEHTVLITSASGNIGSELVPQLIKTGKAKAVLLTSNAQRMQEKLPSHASADKIAIEEGSVRDPKFIEAVIRKHNIDSVFLCLTGTDELMTTLNFFDAMHRAGGVQHLVYLSAAGDYVSEQGRAALMKYHTAAHVLVKSIIEQKLKYAEYPWKTTILAPTLFFSNDLRSKASMLEQGFFDEPLGEAGVSRVALSDIGLAAVNVILDPTKGGRKITIGSKRAYTGTEVCKLWSDVLGREIRMAVADDAFEQQFEEKIRAHRSGDEGKAWARDLKLMYAPFNILGFSMSADDYRVEVEVLGKEAEDYEAWVRKVGASWK